MNLIYKAIHGSNCYGLNGPNSDLDIRGVFIPAREHVLGLNSGPETIQPKEDEDTTYWELRKFVNMCLKANPNALEVLFVDPMFIQSISESFKPIWTNRNLFLTKRCSATFGGYAKQQLYRLRQRKGTAQGMDWATNKVIRKDAMHLARLLLFGQQILDTGNLTTYFKPEDPNRNMLMSIKAGVIPEAEVLAWAEEKFDVLNNTKTNLPDEPEPEVVQAFDVMVQDAVFKAILK